VTENGGGGETKRKTGRTNTETGKQNTHKRTEKKPEEQANTDRTKREERIRRITRTKKGEGERRSADQVSNLFFLHYFV